MILVADMPGRIYLELPEHLDVAYVAALDLPRGAPVLLWTADVVTADPVAVMVLALLLAGRWVGFFGLDLAGPGAWGFDLLQQLAIYSVSEAA